MREQNVGWGFYHPKCVESDVTNGFRSGVPTYCLEAQSDILACGSRYMHTLLLKNFFQRRSPGNS